LILQHYNGKQWLKGFTTFLQFSYSVKGANVAGKLMSLFALILMKQSFRQLFST